MSFRVRLGIGFFALLIWGGLPLAQSSARADQAGTVMQAGGDTRLSRTGFLATPIQKGAVLREGDRLRTGSDGRVELRMADDAVVAVGPDSDFVVERYRSEAAPGSIGLKLAQGAVRIATGLFSKQQPEGFRLQTPTATLGVRGTDFGVDQGATNASMTVRVYSGRVVVNSARGQVEVPTGATLRLTDASSVPQFVDPATGTTRPAPGFESTNPRSPGATPGTPRPSTPPAKRPEPAQPTPPGFSAAPTVLAQASAPSERSVASSKRPRRPGIHQAQDPQRLGDDSYDAHSAGQSSLYY
jgi:hypothetical protein